MFVYFGRKYSVSRSGSRLKGVRCEKCKHAYYYLLTRSAEGHGESAYYLNNRGAEKRAERSAATRLESRLASQHDPVRCPDCGWLQAGMVRDMRWRRYKWINWLVYGLPAIAMGLLGIVALFMSGQRGALNRYRVELAVCALVILAFAVGMRVMQAVLRRQFDPNSESPRRNAPIPHAPPALRAQTDPSSFVRLFATSTRWSDGRWMAIQFPTFGFPPVCCACATPADGQTHLTPFAPPHSGQSVINVPLCRPCARFYARKWWGLTILGALIGVAIAAAMALMIPKLDDLGRAMLGGLVGLFLGIGLAVALPNSFGRPYRIRRWKSDRGTCEIRFAGAEYVSNLVSAEESLRARSPYLTIPANELPPLSD